VANNPRYLVPLAKDEVESLVWSLRVNAETRDSPLIRRLERRLRQIASHEAMLARFDNEPDSLVTL
jgi:hypothetical protein